MFGANYWSLQVGMTFLSILFDKHDKPLTPACKMRFRVSSTPLIENRNTNVINAILHLTEPLKYTCLSTFVSFTRDRNWILGRNDPRDTCKGDVRRRKTRPATLLLINMQRGDSRTLSLMIAPRTHESNSVPARVAAIFKSAINKLEDWDDRDATRCGLAAFLRAYRRDEDTRSECKRMSARTEHAKVSRSVGQVGAKKRATVPPLSKGITRPPGTITSGAINRSNREKRWRLMDKSISSYRTDESWDPRRQVHEEQSFVVLALVVLRRTSYTSDFAWYSDMSRTNFKCTRTTIKVAGVSSILAI